jgi:integrase
MQITSEGPIKITKATIESAWKKRKKDHRLIIRDKECRGLALVQNATTATWVYGYRPRGKDPVTQRRWPNKTVTIGNPGSHSVEDARIEANHIKGRAARGADPAAERKAAAEEATRKRGATLQRLLADYEKALPKRQKMRGGNKRPSPEYVAAELAQVRLALAAMDAKQKPVADLTEDDVSKFIASASGEGGNARARFGSLSRFLDWCRGQKHIAVNPCTEIARTERPKPPQARTQYLKLEDLGRLWRAADNLREPVWRDFTRFLIAVPCRRGEAANMDWSHVNLCEGEWRQPEHLTKNGDPHRLYLHPLAQDVLKARLQAAAEAQAGGDPAKVAYVMATEQLRAGLVFPAPVSGGVIATFADLKTALSDATKLNDGPEGEALQGWTWHDFRRSFATALGEAGIPEAVADAVLNHRQSATRGGVLGVYQRASRWPEQVRAMRLWGELLAAAIEGRQADDGVVVEMRASR